MSKPEVSRASLSEWIAQAGVPFAHDTSGAFERAVDQLLPALGAAVELLALGEALHGGEEILLLRNRLFRHLAERHGYAAIAVESSFTRGFAADAFCQGNATWDDVGSAGFSHGFGKLDANRELLEWMRDRNATVAPERRLRLYGFDIPGDTGPISPSEALAVAIQGLATVDPAAASAAQAKTTDLVGEQARWTNPMAWMNPATSAPLLADASKLRVEAQKLVLALRSRRASFPNPDAYAKALRHAEVAREQANFFLALGSGKYADSLAARDVVMAGNLEYVVDRERPRGKVLAFAHNAHLQKGKCSLPIGDQLSEWWPAGSHLAQTLGPRYAAIATGLGASPENGIASAEPGSLEATLLRDGPATFLPTAGGRDATGKDVFPVRSRSNRNPTYFPLTPQSWTDFDALLLLPTTPYTRGGRPLPE